MEDYNKPEKHDRTTIIWLIGTTILTILTALSALKWGMANWG